MKVKAEVESKVKVSVDKFDKAKVDRGVEQRGEWGLEGGVARVHVPGMLILCDVTHAPHCGN